MTATVDISNVFLETERLTLRPWKNEDLQNLYDYASDEVVGPMAGWEPHKSIEESKTILDMFIDEKKTFALALKSNDKAIGSLGLEIPRTDLGEKYRNLYGREIGYVLSREYWGMGLMTEAVTKVINYYFSELNMDFLQICHNVINERSKRVIEKTGFNYVLTEERMIPQSNAVKIFKHYIMLNPTTHTSVAPQP